MKNALITKFIRKRKDFKIFYLFWTDKENSNKNIGTIYYRENSDDLYFFLDFRSICKINLKKYKDFFVYSVFVSYVLESLRDELDKKK